MGTPKDLKDLYGDILRPTTEYTDIGHKIFLCKAHNLGFGKHEWGYYEDETEKYKRCSTCDLRYNIE